MIILFSKGCPSPLPLPSLRRRRRCTTQATVLHAVGVGSRPYGRRCYPRAVPRKRAVPPCAGAAPAGATALAVGTAYARRRQPCPWATGDACGCPVAGGLGRSRLPLVVGLAGGGRPCMGAGRGWPPLLLTAFATKMQQERIERFYAIQSHHTQFKTKLSYENLGSDITVGKPQRVHQMHSENQNKN
ncbi:hypothetical protein GW17_00039705 [Ensete ventricosum]|nr:hypothetical protein GW17_00039705 [Ensete ventricosum]RZS18248.1 hypothetical protein BHM03_00050481 [Ensete ventricosum]